MGTTGSERAVTITFDGLITARGEYLGYVLRLQLVYGEQRRIADIRIHHDLIALDKIEKEDLVAIALLLGLPRLREVVELEGPDAFFADPAHRWVELNTETVPRVQTPALRKRCHFQLGTKRGLECEVSDASTSGVRLIPLHATTEAVCADCGHPDDRLRCSALMHVWTEAEPELIRPSGYRRDARGSCNAGFLVHPQLNALSPEQAEQVITRCHLGARECARMEWTLDAPAVDPSVDVGRRLVHELDYLDLVVNDRFGFHPRVLTDAESVAALVRDDIATPADFVSALAGLVGLINALSWRAVPDDVKGSLNRLEAFATSRGVALDRRALEALHAIVRLRQGPPIHSAATDAARAATQLGLMYPITDPRAAWRLVRASAATSLRSISDSLRRAPP